MNDLTIIMLTPNLLPQKWADFHKEKLQEAAGDSPIITISSKPLDWGINLIQTEYGFSNIFKQMLRGAKTATTEFVAMADDDTLYPPEHFKYRPPTRGFYYNMTRWHVLAWRRKLFYFYKPLPGNGLMICDRQSMIEALEARFADYPELDGEVCHELGTRKRAMKYDKFEFQKFHTINPVVSFYHTKSLDEANRTKRKAAWPVRAYDLPYWGRVDELIKKFNV